MKMGTQSLRTIGLAGFVATLFACPAFAHHSFAMFDNSRMDALTGTLEDASKAAQASAIQN